MVVFGCLLFSKILKAVAEFAYLRTSGRERGAQAGEASEAIKVSGAMIRDSEQPWATRGVYKKHLAAFGCCQALRFNALPVHLLPRKNT